MPHIVFIIGSIALLVGVCACAMTFGGVGEKFGALCILIANAAAELIIAVGRQYPGNSIFIIDFCLAIALLILAVKYSSLWLGGAMILQGIALYVHALSLMGDQVSTRLYIALNDSLTYLMLACIMAGTLAKVVRSGRRRTGKPFSDLADSHLPLRHELKS